MISYVILLVVVCGIAIVGVVVPRVRMERRAKSLLAAIPDHELTAIYLSFSSAWPSAKRAQLKAKKEEKEAAGWTFLRASEVGPLWTMQSLGGGLTLHFIRKKEANHAPATAPNGRGSS